MVGCMSYYDGVTCKQPSHRPWGRAEIYKEHTKESWHYSSHLHEFAVFHLDRWHHGSTITHLGQPPPYMSSHIHIIPYMSLIHVDAPWKTDDEGQKKRSFPRAIKTHINKQINDDPLGEMYDEVGLTRKKERSERTTKWTMKDIQINTT